MKNNYFKRNFLRQKKFKSKLVISGKSLFPKINNNSEKVYSYLIGGVHGNDEIENLNNNFKINKIAEDIRSDYCNYIYSFNKLFIKNGLTINNEMSSFFLTDFSCKRTELYDTYNDICNCLYIAKLNEKYKFQLIEIYGISGEFVDLIKKINPNVKSYDCFSLKSFIKYSILFNIFDTSRYFLKILGVIILNRFIHEKLDKKGKQKNIFVTRYPLQFKNNQILKEEKYHNFKKKNDYFATSIITDDFHQKKNIFEFAFFVKNLKNSNHLLIDQFIGINHLFKSIFWIIRNIYNLKKILDIKKNFKGLDLTNHFRIELICSFSKLPRLLICLNSFDNFLKYYKPKKVFYHLHEYPYGRMISYLNYKNDIDESIGFQHGPASWRKLVYFLAKNETKTNNFLYCVPIPKKVYAEDSFSKEIYKFNGYKKISVMNYIPRLYYLESINTKKEKIFNLITPGLHDSKIVLDLMIEKIKSNPSIKYVCKLHPRSKFSAKDFKSIPNLSFSNKNINQLLEQTNTLYVTYSSVGNEASKIGIKVINLEIPGVVNQSSLLDLNGDN